MPRVSRKVWIAAGLLWLGTFVLMALPLAWIGAYFRWYPAPWDRLIVATAAALACIAMGAAMFRSFAAAVHAVAASVGMSFLGLGLILVFSAVRKLDAGMGALALASLLVGGAGIFVARRLRDRMPPLGS